MATNAGTANRAMNAIENVKTGIVNRDFILA
jgi:hypothetical protein